MKNKAYASILAALVCVALATLTSCSSGSSSTPPPPPPTVTVVATSGSGQHAATGSAFAGALVATVSKGGTPMSGATVTFTAPASGASGTYSGGTATETDTTDANGVATSSAFTANSTAGAYSVTASVAGASSSASFSLTNDGLLSYYTFYVSGLETINLNFNPNFYSLAGVVSVDSSGNVVGGEQDYSDGAGITSPQPGGDTITGGTLTVDPTTGQGTLTVVTDDVNVGPASAVGTETFAVQFVNTNHALITQFDGSATSSGSMDLQAAPSTPAGPFAFTLSGVDSVSSPMAFGGVLTVTGGNITSGTFDVNDNGTVTLGSTLSGTVSAPDTFGRGTITSAALGLSLVYYTVGPQVARIIDVDTADEAVGSLYGQGSGSFNAASLGTSVFGIESNPDGTLFASVGMLTTNPGSGTFQGVGDDDELGTVVSAAPFSGTYAVASDGYGSLALTTPGLGSINSLGLYMTDPTLNLSDPNNPAGGGGALLLEFDTVLTGGTGVVIPQTDTSTASFAGNYAFGAQDYNSGGVSNLGWEFDFVGQGSVASSALTATAMVSDPFGVFDVTPTLYPGVPVSATITPDSGNPGRYTTPVNITAPSGTVNPFTAVAYQASGDLLFWLDEDAFSIWLGPMEQQGSLAGLPAAKGSPGTTRLKRKLTPGR